jgi:hypothetical protein
VLPHIALGPVRLADLCSLALSSEEIETLLERAIRISNKYSILSRVPPSARDAAGGDDYKKVFSLVNSSLASVDTEHEREVHGIEEEPPPWSPADCLSNRI